MFNKDSGLVLTWVRLVQNGTYSKELIPNIGNLREVVISVLDESVISEGEQP